MIRLIDRGEKFRHHLRHHYHPGRSRQRVRKRLQPTSISTALPSSITRCRIRLRDRGRLLRADRRTVAGALLRLRQSTPLERRRRSRMSPLRRAAWPHRTGVRAPGHRVAERCCSSRRLDAVAGPGNSRSTTPRTRRIFIPEHFNWGNYAAVLASKRFSTYFMNSLIVTGERVPR